MSLLGNGLKGGIGTGIGVGIGVALAAPIVIPIMGAVIKPVAKAGLVGGILLYEKSREILGNVVSEVKSATSKVSTASRK